MNKLITLGVLIPLLFLAVPKAYAESKHCDRDGWPACYNLGYHKGSVDASFDYNSGVIQAVQVVILTISVRVIVMDTAIGGIK